MAGKSIDLKKLRAFHAVAKQGNLRRAAAQLLLTVPAVYAQVRGLEEDLGIRLFERAGRSLALTPSGEILLAKTNQIFDAVNDAVTALVQPADHRKRISIAIVNDLTRLFVHAIGEIVQSNQHFDLALRVRRSPETLALVMDGEVDLGIGYFGSVPRDIVKTTLLRSGYSLVFNAHHPLARIRKPCLQDIAAHRLVSFPANSNMGRHVANAFAAAGSSLKNLIEAGSCQSSQEFAEVGIGAAIVHTACLRDKRSKKLHTFDLGQAFGLVDIAVIRRRSQTFSHEHRQVIDVLKRHGQAG